MSRGRKRTRRWRPRIENERSQRASWGQCQGPGHRFGRNPASSARLRRPLRPRKRWAPWAWAPRQNWRRPRSLHAVANAGRQNVGRAGRTSVAETLERKCSETRGAIILGSLRPRRRRRILGGTLRRTTHFHRLCKTSRGVARCILARRSKVGVNCLR